jgi:hypothetical protein
MAYKQRFQYTSTLPNRYPYHGLIHVDQNGNIHAVYVTGSSSLTYKKLTYNSGTQQFEEAHSYTYTFSVHTNVFPMLAISPDGSNVFIGYRTTSNYLGMLISTNGGQTFSSYTTTVEHSWNANAVYNTADGNFYVCTSYDVTTTANVKVLKVTTAGSVTQLWSSNSSNAYACLMISLKPDGSRGYLVHSSSGATTFTLYQITSLNPFTVSSVGTLSQSTYLNNIIVNYGNTTTDDGVYLSSYTNLYYKKPGLPLSPSNFTMVSNFFPADVYAVSLKGIYFNGKLYMSITKKDGNGIPYPVIYDLDATNGLITLENVSSTGALSDSHAINSHGYIYGFSQRWIPDICYNGDSTQVHLYIFQTDSFGVSGGQVVEKSADASILLTAAASTQKTANINASTLLSITTEATIEVVYANQIEERHAQADLTVSVEALKLAVTSRESGVEIFLSPQAQVSKVSVRTLDAALLLLPLSASQKTSVRSAYISLLVAASTQTEIYQERQIAEREAFAPLFLAADASKNITVNAPALADLYLFAQAEALRASERTAGASLSLVSEASRTAVFNADCSLELLISPIAAAAFIPAGRKTKMVVSKAGASDPWLSRASVEESV